MSVNHPAGIIGRPGAERYSLAMPREGRACRRAVALTEHTQYKIMPMPAHRKPRFRDRTYAAFLFDLDGTMLDSSSVVERTWRAWAKRHEIDPTNLLEAAQGVRSEDTIRRFGPAGIDVAREAAWFLGMELSDIEGVVPIAGIGTLIESLHPDNWAVVTSASRVLAELRLRSVQLPIPKTLVTAEDVKQGKPSPEGYLKAATTLGVPISECLVFEDSAAGVAAGKAAGAHVAIVGNRVPASEGTIIIPDYH